MPLSSDTASDLPAGEVIIHCQKGGRGNTACETLRKQNPALEIYNLASGRMERRGTSAGA
jgi:rhodanese-related sulfurtransferase